MVDIKKCLIPGLVLLILLVINAQAQEKQFELHGIYLEGCTCNLVCTCDLMGGMAPGCQVMGAAILTSGTYNNTDISNVKIAFAVGNKWVRIFIQSEDPARFENAANFSRAIFGAYGKIESIQKAEIDLEGKDGNYVLKVGGGKVLHLKTQPVLGADMKTPVTYTNYPDPIFHTIMQAKVITGRFKDGKHHFKLKNTNSFFNPNWSITGKI